MDTLGQDPGQVYLTVRESADLLRTSTKTIRRYVKKHLWGTVIEPFNGSKIRKILKEHVLHKRIVETLDKPIQAPMSRDTHSGQSRPVQTSTALISRDQYQELFDLLRAHLTKPKPQPFESTRAGRVLVALVYLVLLLSLGATLGIIIAIAHRLELL